MSVCGSALGVVFFEGLGREVVEEDHPGIIPGAVEEGY